jgi:DNA-binding transcriptional LysR family regulator
VSRTNEHLSDLRLADVMTFLTVLRAGSITGAARELKVTPSQVSKAIARLENQFQATLLSRGARGVGISEDGVRIASELSEVVARLAKIGAHDKELPQVTIAAASFMVSRFVPAIATALPGFRFRAVDMAPALVRSHASEGFFDLVLTLGPARLPSLWSETRVGEVRKALFASPVVAARLSADGPVTEQKLRSVPFISPLYSVDRSFVPVDDDCPLPRAQRLLGHEVQTIAVALDLAVGTEQVVFGPAMCADEHVRKGLLVEIPVTGWDVREVLYVSCNVDRVLAHAQKAIIEAVRTCVVN